MDFNGYQLSREWFDFCFENPDKINPNHSAMYFFIIEHCNRLGWKEKFGLPTSMVKDAIGIRNFRTYKKTLDDLVNFGFIKMVEISKNQYSSNIIAIVKNTKAHAKALDKALQKHSQKHCKSIDSIDKQLTNEPIEQIKPKKLDLDFSIFTEEEKKVIIEWTEFRKEIKKPLTQISINSLKKEIDKKGLIIVKTEIQQSIKNGWQGLFPIKNEQIQTPEKKYQVSDAEKLGENRLLFPNQIKNMTK